MADTCTCVLVYDEEKKMWRTLTDPECPRHGDR